MNNLESFLMNPQIQHLLEENNLDGVYEELSKINIPLAKFTEFLLNKVHIQPLDYMQYVVPYMYQDSEIENIIIPDNIKTIGNAAFYRCSSLQSVTIGNSVTSIGNSAFTHCRSLTTITIPDSVESIGDYAFYDCTSLRRVTIPDSVTYIGKYAFSGCSSLQSVTIPDSVESIGDYAFKYCTKLVIKCKEDSYAHKYALDNNMKYELI